MERLVKQNRRPVLLVKNPSAAPYRTVLVPVSFSASCAAALRLARVLAPDARLTKFHALHVPFAGLTSDQPDSHATRQMLAEAEAQRSLWARIHDLPDDLADVPVLTGGLSQVLASQIKATSPDLICIGAHSRSGLSPYTLGSFAAQLIRDPATDLLIVRPTLPN
jgi:nucleotide-binding universal stress UspA family protein